MGAVRKLRRLLDEVGDPLTPGDGPAVLDAVRHIVPGVIGVAPAGGKFSRAAAAEPRVKAGQVWLHRPSTPDGRRIPGREWVADFVEQLAQFPHGAHDDDVDAFSQLVAKWASPLMAPGMRVRLLRAGRDYQPHRRIF